MIIKTGVTANGTEYAIDDSFMVSRGSVEESLTIEEQRRIAHDILVDFATRHEREQMTA